MYVVTQDDADITFHPFIHFNNLVNDTISKIRLPVLKSNNSKFILLFTTSDLNSIDLSNDTLIDFLKYRTENKLPVYVVYDHSFEAHLTDDKINEIILFFKNLGLDVDNNLLIINSRSQSPTAPDNQNTNVLTYDQFVVDAFYWKTTIPRKFTELPLASRPNLANLIVSKLTEKKSRVELVYEFYKKNLLNQCLLSIMGTIDEFSYIDDSNFLIEIEQKLDNIGGNIASFQEGMSNSEFGCQTSNRTIFNNSRLSCVHETSHFSSISNTWEGNGMITEKFYRAVLNKTPFIVFGYPNIYNRIRNKGFDTFNSIIDLTFDRVQDSAVKIKMYADQVEKFLSINPSKLVEIQEICDNNYQKLMNDATKEYKIYKDRIQQFLNQ